MKISRLKRGDFVAAELTEKVSGVKSGLVVGLGALSWVSLKSYNLETKKYLQKRIDGPLEVVSFQATIAEGVDGKIGLHPHIVVSDENFACFGGHLEEAEVGATFEYVILDSDEEIKRYYDEEIGLNLIDR